MKIFKACMETSRSAKEIVDLTGMNHSEVAEDLETLQRHKILVFLEGRWKATSTAIEVFQKYFGA
jgi:DNA-binding IclR family transcriptional regulator